ncbi:MAG: DUF4254 domain-containing protein [Candidatus Omnitrophota bacterium]|jgi:hypothetical protein
MAETLGSMVDKLTIKEIRGFHLQEMLESKDNKFPVEQLKEKLKILEGQKKDLIDEIDGFVVLASQGKIKVTSDEKLKIYNAVKDIGNIPQEINIGQAISGLAGKNLELWHLEDEARRKDVELSYIGEVKRKIDLANQQRNDFIDKIDRIFEKEIQKSAKK